ncbi:hypothetical protein HY492_00445 [Candidatus Woesearchaeota archaeon]|nr:hypothetical protein [Candidatus Woesearchaeota archaeon]
MYTITAGLEYPEQEQTGAMLLNVPSLISHLELLALTQPDETFFPKAHALTCAYFARHPEDYSTFQRIDDEDHPQSLRHFLKVASR